MCKIREEGVGLLVVVAFSYVLSFVIFLFQSGQLDLKHFDPEFVREPVPGKCPLFSPCCLLRCKCSLLGGVCFLVKELSFFFFVKCSGLCRVPIGVGGDGLS